MVDINFDTKVVRRGAMAGVVRRRRWGEEEKGRIVAEAVAPGAVIAEVARRHDLAPQHLSNWIRAAKDGRFVLPGDAMPSFVPILSEETVAMSKPVCEDALPSPASQDGSASIEIAIGSVRLAVRNGADMRTIEAVLRAVRRCFA